MWVRHEDRGRERVWVVVLVVVGEVVEDLVEDRWR